MLVSNTFSSNPVILIPLVLATLLLVLGLISSTSGTSSWSYGNRNTHRPAPPSSAGFFSHHRWRLGSSSEHPIDSLVQKAQDEFDRLLRNEPLVSTLEDAATTYRKKRGRHPPPDFDKWYEFAQSKNAIVIEDLFDQIYLDLEPFWSLEPAALREETLEWPYIFSIRGGVAQKRAARPVAGEWMQFWLKMFAQIPNLPDVDLAINALDESRVIVPWEDMNEHVKRAEATKSTMVPVDHSQIVPKFPSLKALSFKPADIRLKGLKFPDNLGPWNQPIPLWNLTRDACPPDSSARSMEQDKNFKLPPEIFAGLPNGTNHGFISNWTDSKAVCSHPDLANLYGFFVNPRYNSVNTSLVPLFGGCKVHGINNEILLPAAKYFSDEEDFDFEGQGIPWESKKDAIVWRGQATGGAHKKENWKHFHRHRFIAMMNGSLVTREERSQPRLLKDREQALLAEQQEERDPPPHNFPIPSSDDNVWGLSALKTEPTSLGTWISLKANVGFDHFMCAPWIWSVLGNGKRCGYMDPYFKAQDRITMEEQFTYKYLPDIDGNSYSGRYRAFLKSNSLPIKSTIWSEWHDSRLIAWKHFVPMDNTFIDFWGIMEYFLGYGGREGDSLDPKLKKDGHDEVARMIADDGRDWADRVLREDDMVVYAYRLILEYKRITSDERRYMMWVEDLL